MCIRDSDYVEQTIKYNQPINITTKDGNAVLLTEEDYSGIMEKMCIRDRV